MIIPVPTVGVDDCGCYLQISSDHPPALKGDLRLRPDRPIDRAVRLRAGHPRTDRVETERFKAFTYDELVARDQTNLDIIWLHDESFGDLDKLPAPEIIAREIVEDLTAALVEFEAVAAALEAAGGQSRTTFEDVDAAL